MRHLVTPLLFLFIASPCANASTRAASHGIRKDLAAYNIVWDSQSKGSVDSMPLSGGILGLNVWVEKGDLCFLIGSPNNMDENGMQPKLGLVRLHYSPAVFEQDFRQELRLGQSEILVNGKTASGEPVSVKLWCAVEHPVIHVETIAGEAVEVTATYETWSDYQAKSEKGAIQWHRRLAEINARRQQNMKAQGMTNFADKIPDPLSRLTCGGRMTAPGMVDAGTGEGKFNGLKTKTFSLKTAAPVKQLDLCVTLRMEQDKSLADWETQLDRDAIRAAQNTRVDRKASQAWWDAFWNRSHITVNPGAPDSDEAWQAGRNYQLIRYLSASNINGRAMTLFNGGQFTCSGNPDRRAWDGCQFMAQNQRLVYWPMLRAGDFDLLQVATDFYRDRTEMNRLHTRKFWDVDGVAWNEPFSIFGLDAIGTTAQGRSAPGHLQYNYTSNMDFALMMLEMERYTGKSFAGYIEAALGIISYYDNYYQKVTRVRTGKPLDEKGRLVIYPASARETYHGCTNNTDVIAGLTALSRELLALPDDRLPASERSFVEGFRKRIPEFPMVKKDGRKFFAAAKSWESVFQNGNMEFPQMDVCFPFGVLSLGRSDMTLVKNTWDLSAINPRVQRQNQCWYQSAITLARMGETAQAARYTVDKLRHPGERFPVFYHVHYIDGREGFCQAPDADHGGVAMTALQEMIMQADGRRILLGGAWPADWNGSFKLHAPYQTVVAGRVADGKVIVEKVTPETRRKDIEIFPLKKLPPPPPPSLANGKLATASSVYAGGYEADKAFDSNPKTRWAARDSKSGWLAVDLGQPMEVSRVVVQENSYPRVTRFAFEAQLADDSWKALATGTTLGEDKELTFAPEKARVFRLNILDASDAPTVDEVLLYAK
jgi:hypothetical protein